MTSGHRLVMLPYHVFRNAYMGSLFGLQGKGVYQYTKKYGANVDGYRYFSSWL